MVAARNTEAAVAVVATVEVVLGAANKVEVLQAVSQGMVVVRAVEASLALAAMTAAEAC